MEISRDILEAFKLLSNKANLELLLLLSSKELNPRELARLTGRDETDVSRRLRRLEKAGILVSQWRRVAGRNVKVYSLRSNRLCLRLGEEGARLDTEPGLEPSMLAGHVAGALAPPRPPGDFSGRRRELAALSEARGLIVVTGLPGIGKTSLLAEYAARSGRPTAWYTFTGLEDLHTFYWKLSLFMSMFGFREPYELIHSGLGNIQGLASTLAEAMDAAGLLLVLDDFHRVSDRSISALVAYTGSYITRSQLVVLSRRKPTGLLSSTPGAKLLTLGGLSPQETEEALQKLGVGLRAQELSKLYSATQGHPLLVRMFAEIAAKHGVDEALRRLEKQRLRDLWRNILEALSPCEAEILEVLAELAIPAPKPLLENLVHCRGAGLALFRLVDSGLVEERGENYRVKDIVLRLRPGRGSPGLLLKAGDWFLAARTAQGVIYALHLYSRAGSERHIVKAIRRRMSIIGPEMSIAEKLYMKRLREALEEARSPYTRAYILLEMATGESNAGNLDAAYMAANTAYRILRRYRDVAAQLVAIARLLWLYPITGAAEAEKLVEEAESLIGLVEKDGSEIAAEALTLFYANLARYYAAKGNPGRALEAVEAEVEAAKKRGGLAVPLSRLHLAVALGLNCRYEEAREVAERTLSHLYPDAPDTLIARALWILGDVSLHLGDWGEAYRNSREAYHVFRRYGHLLPVAENLGIQSLAALRMGSLDSAYRAASELARLVEDRLGSWRGIELAGLAAAAVYAARGREEEAKRLAERVIRAIRQRGDRLTPCEAKPYLEALEAHLGSVRVPEDVVAQR